MIDPIIIAKRYQWILLGDYFKDGDKSDIKQC